MSAIMCISVYTGRDVPQSIDDADPLLQLGRIDARKLNHALFPVHLPTCARKSHVHFTLAEDLPADASGADRVASYVGGCKCFGNVEIEQGPEKIGGWDLSFLATPGNGAKPVALWRGHNPDTANPFGTYRRVGGLAASLAAIVLEKWRAE
jgi:hypothetical protein